MNWNDVGNWIKNNAGTGAKLVGSLITGNVPLAVAAGISLASSATGTDDPAEALQAFQSDPQTVVRLKELANENEADIRRHLETMERQRLEDAQKEHSETQTTIRAGDQSDDEYVRRTRPEMARQSWRATVAYCLGCFVFEAFRTTDLFSIYLAGFLSTPAWAYIGLRTGDKFAAVLGKRKTGV